MNEMVKRLTETGDYTEEELSGMDKMDLFVEWCRYEGYGNPYTIISALRDCGFIVR